MKRAIIAGLLILILFGAGEHPRLVVHVETPSGSQFELRSVPVSCATVRTEIETRFGDRDHCVDRCSDPADAEGTYQFHIGVVPELRCLGPQGAQVIEGTGALHTTQVSFCADPYCLVTLDYCDCTPPFLSVPPSDRWYSEPFTIEVFANDSYGVRRIEAGEVYRCTGTACAVNLTVPIGTACTQTGSRTCALRVNATDHWENSAQVVERYNVDLNAPISTHTWLSDDSWHRDLVRIRFEAHEPTEDESGVDSLFIEQRTGPDCSPPGANYTRHPPSVTLSVADEGDRVAFCYYATDRAVPANRGEVLRTGVHAADTRPPRITSEPGPGWYASNPLVRVGCTDDQSGCVSFGHLFADACPPAGDARYQSAPIVTDCAQGAVCSYRVCAWARDGVGHETLYDYELSIDRSAPVIEHIQTFANATVALLISDAGSGLSRCETITDTGTRIPCTVSGALTSVTIDVGCESCTYHVRVEDAVGNEATYEGSIHASI